jgi:hypothetical protein
MVPCDVAEMGKLVANAKIVSQVLEYGQAHVVERGGSAAARARSGRVV